MCVREQEGKEEWDDNWGKVNRDNVTNKYGNMKLKEKMGECEFWRENRQLCVGEVIKKGSSLKYETVFLVLPQQ